MTAVSHRKSWTSQWGATICYQEDLEKNQHETPGPSGATCWRLDFMVLLQRTNCLDAFQLILNFQRQLYHIEWITHLMFSRVCIYEMLQTDTWSLYNELFFCSRWWGHCGKVLRHFLDSRLLPEIQETQGGGTCWMSTPFQHHNCSTGEQCEVYNTAFHHFTYSLIAHYLHIYSMTYRTVHVTAHFVCTGRSAHAAWSRPGDPSSHIMWPTGWRSSRSQPRWRGRHL